MQHSIHLLPIVMTFQRIITQDGFDFALGASFDNILSDSPDSISFATLPSDQLSSLSSSSAIDVIALFGGADSVVGDDSASYFFGNVGNDTLSGGGGADTLYGGKDADVVNGDAGDDVIFGDLGNDTLSGGLGSDSLTGGDGADVFLLALDEGTDVIQDFITGSDTLQLPDGVAVADVSIADGQVTVAATGQVLAQITGAFTAADLTEGAPISSTSGVDDATATPTDESFPDFPDLALGGGENASRRNAPSFTDRWLIRTQTWVDGSWQKGQDLTQTRNDDRFAADWGAGRPSSALRNDYFSQQLYTQDNLSKDQQYNFSVRADDYYFIALKAPGAGSWEFITLDNNKPAWKQDAYGRKDIAFKPSVSGTYEIVVGHYETGGNAYLDVSWRGRELPVVDLGSVEIGNDFEMPLPGGYNWRVNQSYAGSYSHGGQAAIDFGAYTWDSQNGSKLRNNIPVLAAADGVVYDVTSQTTGYGKHVRIDHDFPYDGSGLVSIYAHLDSLSVSEGQRLKQGDKLGNMGNTGNSGGTHLHFELRKDGSSNSNLNELKNLELGNTDMDDFNFSGWGFEINKGYRSGNRYYAV